MAAAAGSGMGMAGGIISAAAQIQAGENARKVGHYNAAELSYASQEAIDRGNIEASMVRNKARKILGAQTAAAAASGFDVNSGDSLSFLTETAGMSELDALRTINNAQRVARGLKMKSQFTDWEGDNAANAGYLNAAGTILSSAGGAASGFYGAKGGLTSANNTTI